MNYSMAVTVPGLSNFGRYFILLGGMGIPTVGIVESIINPGTDIAMVLVLLTISVISWMMFVSWTRISPEGLEYKILHRHRVRFDEIESVVGAQQSCAFIFNVCVLVRVKLKTGKVFEFMIDTPENTKTVLNILNVHIAGAAQVNIGTIHHI